MGGGDNPEDERSRLVKLAMRLIEQRGGEVTRAAIAAAAGISRARVDVVFSEESDVFDGVVEMWFAEPTAIMEEVLASDLPPNRKMYEFFARRFRLQRARYRADPAAFKVYCELGSTQFERVRSYIDLADHYLCELIAQAQAESAFEGLAIDEALSLINQMTHTYTMAEILTYLDERLSEEKLGRIIDTLFAGLSAADGGARGVKGLRAA